VEEVFLAMVTKFMDIPVLPKLATNLWMFRGGIHTFALVINYLFEAWEHVYTIVGLFEVNETISSCMA
jgi:hypothetical protein